MKTIVRLVGLFLLLHGSAQAQDGLPECFVKFSAYDPAGVRLTSLEISSLELMDEDAGWRVKSDLLGAEPGNLRPVIRGDRVYFQKQLLGLYPVRVRLWSSGHSAGSWVAFRACRQRESVFVGEIGYQYADAFSFSGSGQVTGCNLYGDWWVRVEPLFGAAPSHESTVEPTTGRFTFTFHIWTRHTILVGKSGAR